MNVFMAKKRVQVKNKCIYGDKFMMELPISKDIKEYYKKQNKEFTDSEKATIFWNSMLPCNEKLTALKEIMESTADEILKEQIQKRLETEAEKEKLFMLHDSDYVHSVILDDGKGTDGVFHSIDAAILYGKENCKETFEIRKDLLEDKAEMDTDENVLLGGKAEFKKDGTIVCCECYNSKEIEVTFLNGTEATDFEEAYIEVMNPFEYGDIVHMIGDSRPAIVVASQEHWKKIKEGQKQSTFPLNYYSNSLTIEFLYPDGEFSHGHPDIFELEKVTEWEDEKEWELLQSISALMKGEGWVETIFHKYHANKWDKR